MRDVHWKPNLYRHIPADTAIERLLGRRRRVYSTWSLPHGYVVFAGEHKSSDGSCDQFQMSDKHYGAGFSQ